MGLFSELFSNSSISEPSVNVDGSPMCGSVDINGNPYGVTSPDDSFDSCSIFDDSFSTTDSSSCFDDSFSSFDSSSGFDDW